MRQTEHLQRERRTAAVNNENENRIVRGFQVLQLNDHELRANKHYVRKNDSLAFKR